jgi:hypothetical protein
MRAILVSALMLLGVASSAHEPELFGSKMRVDQASAYQLVAIESTSHRGDRLSFATLQPRALRVEVLRRDNRDAPLRLASLGSEFDINETMDSEESGASEPNGTSGESLGPSPLSLDNLCNTLFTSAQDNDLPVPFFANLLWQESRLRNDVVSKKGAVGIAQFMPNTAVETGLANPFDPMQAIPASARFLQRLRLQFGNLGFVAAAYNAGPRRVIEWLEHRGSLPRETRGYVLRVTGLTAEAWRRMPVDNEALTFVPRLPCRNLPAFANVEQEQMQQAQLERVQHIRMPSEEELDAQVAADRDGEGTKKNPHEQKQASHNKRGNAHADARRPGREHHLARREPVKHEATKHDAAKHEVAKRAGAKHEATKHEAAHGQRRAREKRRSA